MGGEDVTAKIVIHAMERSLPNDVPYWSERITSFSIEEDLQPGHGPTDPAFQAKVAAIRAAQLADLAQQEAMLRQRFDIPTPSGKGDRQARLDAARAAQGLSPAVVAPRGSSSPPAGPRAGGTVEATVGAVVDDADSAVREAAGMPPAPGQVAVKPAAPVGPPVHVERAPIERIIPPSTATVPPIAQPFPTVGVVKPNERKCSHTGHPINKPAFIDSSQYATSLKFYGMPLCVSHVKTATKLVP